MSDPVEPAASDRAESAQIDASRYTAQLATLDALPVAGHADVYQAVHSELQAALAEIDGR